MTKEEARQICERYQELLFQAALTDREIEFLRGHEENCPLGIHTVEALERTHGLSAYSLRNLKWGDPLPRSEPGVLRGHVQRLLEIPPEKAGAFSSPPRSR